MWRLTRCQEEELVVLYRDESSLSVVLVNTWDINHNNTQISTRLAVCQVKQPGNLKLTNSKCDIQRFHFAIEAASGGGDKHTHQRRQSFQVTSKS